MVDPSLPFVAKAKDRLRVVELWVSLAAVEAADSGFLSVPLDQVVQEPESDSALRADPVGAPQGLGPPNEADRGELGQTHSIRGAAGVDVCDERLNTIARHRLMAPGRGTVGAEVTAEDVSEIGFLLNQGERKSEWKSLALRRGQDCWTVPVARLPDHLDQLVICSHCRGHACPPFFRSAVAKG